MMVDRVSFLSRRSSFWSCASGDVRGFATRFLTTRLRLAVSSNAGDADGNFIMQHLSVKFWTKDSSDNFVEISILRDLDAHLLRRDARVTPSYRENKVTLAHYLRRGQSTTGPCRSLIIYRCASRGSQPLFYRRRLTKHAPHSMCRVYGKWSNTAK